MNRTPAWVLFALLLGVIGCANIAPLDVGRLKPEVRLSMGEDGQALIRIGVTNVGTGALPANEAFQGVMEVRDGAGVVQSRIDAHKLGALEPGQTDMFGSLRTRYEPGTYRLLWNAPTMGQIALEFDILEQDGKMLLRADSRYIEPFTTHTVTGSGG